MTDAYERLKRVARLRETRNTRPTNAPSLATPDAPTATPTIPTIPGTTELPSGTGASLTVPALNNGWARRVSGTAEDSYMENPPYPPAGYTDAEHPDAQTGVFVRKNYTYVSPDTSGYDISVGLMKFDTSSVPDAVLITGATLRLYIYLMFNHNNRDLTFEWAEWTGDRGTTDDWTASAGTDAHPGVPLGSLPSSPGSWFEIPLQNYAPNVSKTGVTYLKAHISGGAPGIYNTELGYNWAYWEGIGYQGYAPGNEDRAPRLVLSYVT